MANGSTKPTLPEKLEQISEQTGTVKDDINKLIDEGFYFSKYPDVAQSPMSAVEHYMKHGWKERRQPNAWFDVEAYIAHFPELKDNRLNPLEHYLKKGICTEFGRNLRPAPKAEAGLPAEAVSSAAKYGREFQVSPALHSADMVLDFLLQPNRFNSIDSAVQYYFADGDNSARKFAGIINKYFGNRHSLNILEFASGYGCVSRHLKKRLPEENFCACDIHPEAKRFIEGAMGFMCFLSDPEPEKLKIDGKFDAVFALSFFSHMPPATFQRWLASLANLLEPGGIMVFTTHGLTSARHTKKDVEKMKREGCLFLKESEQKDLPLDTYGNMMVTPKYVLDCVTAINTVEALEFQASFWWNHQDLYVLRKA